MANYACVSVRKLTSTQALVGAYKHNYREISTPNVNPALSHLNDEAVKLDGKNYKDAFDKKLASLDYYKDHKFRKDGVRAFELTLEYSPEAAGTFNLDEWKTENVKWLQDYFGKDNVASVMFHYDEGVYEGCGAIHGHAIVIPVDDRGHICADSFIRGKGSLVKLQNSYAKSMERFGLERGIQGGHMKHEDIARIYKRTSMELAKEPVPAKIQGESDKDYADRLRQRIEGMKAADVRKDYLHEKEVRELKAQNRTRTKTQKDKRIAYLETENGRLENELDDINGQVRELGGWNACFEKAESLDLLNYGIENHPDEEFAEAVSSNAGEMIEWARSERKKQRTNIVEQNETK